jgi:hypothetical protein
VFYCCDVEGTSFCALIFAPADPHRSLCRRSPGAAVLHGLAGTVLEDTPSSAGTDKPLGDVSGAVGPVDVVAWPATDWPATGLGPTVATPPAPTGGAPVVPPITPPLVGGSWLGEVGGAAAGGIGAPLTTAPAGAPPPTGPAGGSCSARSTAAGSTSRTGQSERPMASGSVGFRSAPRHADAR